MLQRKYFNLREEIEKNLKPVKTKQKNRVSYWWFLITVPVSILGVVVLFLPLWFNETPEVFFKIGGSAIFIVGSLASFFIYFTNTFRRVEFVSDIDFKYIYEQLLSAKYNMEISNFNISNSDKNDDDQILDLLIGQQLIWTSTLSFTYKECDLNFILAYSSYLAVSKSGLMEVEKYPQIFIQASLKKPVTSNKIEIGLKKIIEPKDLELLKTESSEFDQIANIWTDDQVKSRKFFSPAKISKIIDFVSENQSYNVEYMSINQGHVFGEVKLDENSEFYNETFDHLQVQNRIKTWTNDLCHKFLRISTLIDSVIQELVVFGLVDN